MGGRIGGGKRKAQSSFLPRRQGVGSAGGLGPVSCLAPDHLYGMYPCHKVRTGFDNAGFFALAG